MNLKDYTWDKEFEIKGCFSDTPDDIQGQASLNGILRYSPREIVLELFGGFETEIGISIGFGKSLEKIYGFSSNGKILILNTYGEPYGNFSYPGFPITKYKVKNFRIYNVLYQELENYESNPAALRDLINELDSEKIKEYTFSFEHLEEWVGKALVKARYKENQTIFESTVDEYPPTKVLIKSLNMNFEDGATLHALYETLSFKSDYFIKLTSVDSAPKNFDEFYSASCKIKALVEILSNLPLPFTNIEFLVRDKMLKNKCLPIIKGKFFMQHVRKFKKWENSSQQDISLRSLGDGFECILNNWFNKSEKLEFIVRQFSKNLYGTLYLEDQLVDAIRNLEVYSRNFVDSETQCLSEEEARQSVIDHGDDCIPKEVGSRLEKRSRFNKRKESTLFNRLSNLFTSIDETNQTKIFSSSIYRDSLIPKLIETRNYRTHGDLKDRYPKMITDINEMYRTILLLQEILRYYICKELNIG